MENGKSIGDVIGECLRPTTVSAMSEKTILDQLRESIRELDGEIAEEEGRLDDLRARRFDLFAEEDRIRGDLLAMGYHRAEAALRRDRNPETTQAVHVAFCRHMAAMHLRNGTVPAPGALAADIEQTMDELRGGSVQ